MVNTRMMKNSEIYSIANGLLENFQGDLKLPVKVNFYLQKNIKTIISLAQEIEQARMESFEKYGTKNDEGQYNFEPEVVDTVNKELNDLFGLEQEVSYNTILLDSIEDVELTSAQLNAISFMIDEGEE